MKTSANLGLNLPEGTDTIDLIGQYNPNFEKIDSSLAENTTDITNIKSLNSFYNLNSMKNNRKIPLTFNSESGHYSSYTGDKAVNGIMEIDASANSGWAIQPSNIFTGFLKLNAPIGVAIGDSIIAGHPAFNSQLEQGLTPSNEVPGIIEYHLEEYTKIKVYDHGIGGQMLSDFRARWNRDVLAQTVSSLTPTSTLPKMPIFVIIGTGINDVFGGRALADMQSDMTFMINSAIANNIYPIVLNCGPHALMDSTKLSLVKSYNAWLVTMAAQTPNMTLIDFYSFFNDPNNDGKPLSGVFADNVHPTQVSYQRLTKKIIDEAFNDSKPATIPKYLNISTAINLSNSSTGLWRPVGVLLSINDIPRKFVQLKNTPNQVIQIPSIDEVINTITLQPIVAEAPTEANSNTYSITYLSEVYLSDKNLYPYNMLDKDSNIDTVNAVSGINPFYPAIPDTSQAGRFTYTSTASDANFTGIFAKLTTTTGYLCNRGLAIIKNNGSFYVGDYIATSTAGNFTRSNNPPAASIKGRVLKANSTACLVELF